MSLHSRAAVCFFCPNAWRLGTADCWKCSLAAFPGKMRVFLLAQGKLSRYLASYGFVVQWLFGNNEMYHSLWSVHPTLAMNLCRVGCHSPYCHPLRIAILISLCPGCQPIVSPPAQPVGGDPFPCSLVGADMFRFWSPVWKSWWWSRGGMCLNWIQKSSLSSEERLASMP